MLELRVYHCTMGGFDLIARLHVSSCWTLMRQTVWFEVRVSELGRKESRGCCDVVVNEMTGKGCASSRELLRLVDVQAIAEYALVVVPNASRGWLPSEGLHKSCRWREDVNYWYYNNQILWSWSDFQGINAKSSVPKTRVCSKFGWCEPEVERFITKPESYLTNSAYQRCHPWYNL